MVSDQFSEFISIVQILKNKISDKYTSYPNLYTTMNGNDDSPEMWVGKPTFVLQKMAVLPEERVRICKILVGRPNWFYFNNYNKNLL